MEMTLTVDGNECTLQEFIQTNSEDPDVTPLHSDEIEQVKNLNPEESIFLGMGVEVKRIR